MQYSRALKSQTNVKYIALADDIMWLFFDSQKI